MKVKLNKGFAYIIYKVHVNIVMKSVHFSIQTMRINLVIASITESMVTVIEWILVHLDTQLMINSIFQLQDLNKSLVHTLREVIVTKEMNVDL